MPAVGVHELTGLSGIYYGIPTRLLNRVPTKASMERRRIFIQVFSAQKGLDHNSAYPR
jgi:hypothetical protein